MGDHKGTSLVYARTLVKQRGADGERALLAMLSQEEVRIYESVLASSWVPIESATAILLATAGVCFPGDREGLQRVGRGMAGDHLHGVYKALLRMATVPFLLRQAAALWTTYHNEGRARAEAQGESTGVLIVEGYRSLPAAFRTLLIGYVRGTMELTGAKDVRVSHDDREAEAWRWLVTWRP